MAIKQVSDNLLGFINSLPDSAQVGQKGAEISSGQEGEKAEPQKILQLVYEFIAKTDLHSKSAEEMLETLRQKLSHQTSSHEDAFRELIYKIDSLKSILQFIRTNSISRNFIQTPFDVRAEESMAFPDKVSCVSIFISECRDFLASQLCVSALKDRTPVIIPSRPLIGVLLDSQSLCLSDNDWWIYQNTTQDLILFLPKCTGESSLLALKTFGYNVLKLSPITFLELAKSVQSFDEISDEQYLQQISQRLPELFVDKEIKKRINFHGHGGQHSSSNAAKESQPTKVVGLTIEQVRSCIKKIEGLDYCNCITCFGGKNVIKVFGNKPRSFTVTMCSVGDFPVLGALKTPDSSQLRVTLTHYALFWNYINAAMAPGKRKAKNFITALEYMYGNSVFAIPTISIEGKAHFKTVNVHERSFVLDYKRLLQHGGSHTSTSCIEQIDPFVAQEECLLIHPQVVSVPIHIRKSQRTDAFPIILSKIPDNNHLLLASVQVTGGTLKEFIKSSLFFEDVPFLWAETSTTRIVAIKELTAITETGKETYVHVVTVASPKDKLVIFQKKDELHKWYVDDCGICEIDTAEVQLMLYRLFSTVSSSPESYMYVRGSAQIPLPTKEEVLKYYKEWFGFLSSENSIVAALEKMDEGDFPALQKIIETLDGSSCQVLLLHAVQKNNIAAVQALQGHATGIDKKFFTYETILNEACRTASAEVVKAILHMGARLETRGRCAPLLTAIEFGREEIVELLCSQKASVERCLDACIKFKQKACVNVILKYCEEQDLLDAVGTVTETHQQDIASQIVKERMERNFRREEELQRMKEELQRRGEPLLKNLLS